MQKIAIFLISLIMMSTTCISKDVLKSSIYVENRLNSSIYIVYSFNYPDTTINYFTKNVLKANPRYYFKPLESNYLGLYGFCKEKYWREKILSDTILIFILDKNSVDAGSWDDYASGDKYLRRYKLSYEDIINNGCKIVVE